MQPHLITAIVRSSIVAYNEGLAGLPYNPAYTTHEAMAWEIGQAERAGYGA